MHPPKTYDPAQRSDAANYQRHCFEVLHMKCRSQLWHLFRGLRIKNPNAVLSFPPKCYKQAMSLFQVVWTRLRKMFAAGLNSGCNLFLR